MWRPDKHKTHLQNNSILNCLALTQIVILSVSLAFLATCWEAQRGSRGGPAFHQPEGQVIRTDAELAGEGSLGAAGSPHGACGEHVQRLVGLSGVAHFTLQTLASFAQSFTRGTHEPSQYGLLMQTTFGYWFRKKKNALYGADCRGPVLESCPSSAAWSPSLG